MNTKKREGTRMDIMSNSFHPIYMIGNELMRKRKGSIMSINELSKASNIHWNTAKKYIKLANFIQNNYPKIQLHEEGNTYLIEIKETMGESMGLSKREDFLIFLYDKNAINKNNAMPIEDFPDMNKDEIESMIEKGFIKENEDGKIFLSSLGVTIALNYKGSIIDNYYNSFNDLNDEKYATKKDIRQMIIEILEHVRGETKTNISVPIEELGNNVIEKPKKFGEANYIEPTRKPIKIVGVASA